MSSIVWQVSQVLAKSQAKVSQKRKSYLGDVKKMTDWAPSILSLLFVSLQYSGNT